MLPRLAWLGLAALTLTACGDDFQPPATDGPSTNGWSKSFGDASEQSITSVAVDADGSVYVTGGFGGFTDFGGGALEATGMSEDVFIAKYDTDGNFVWSRRFGDASNQRGEAIALGPNNEVVVVGSFTGTLDFADVVLSSSDQIDLFVIVLTADEGDEVWGTSLEGTAWDEARALSVDRGGNIIIAGDFQGGINLMGTDGNGEMFNSAGEDDIFVAKLLPDGAFVWARRFGDLVSESVTDVATDANGNIAITGYLRGGSAIDFGGGAHDPVGVDPNDDAFLVMLGPDGGYQWSKRIGDEFTQRGFGVSFDAAGDLLCTGHFGGTIDFGGSSRTSAGNLDAYLAKLDLGGVPVWTKAFGVTSNNYGQSVGADPSNNIILTGNFEGIVEFGGPELTSAGESDIFLARLDSASGHASSLRFGDLITQSAADIAVDSAGNAILVGNFYGSVDFGFGEHASANELDQNPFVAKMP